MPDKNKSHYLANCICLFLLASLSVVYIALNRYNETKIIGEYLLLFLWSGGDIVLVISSFLLWRIAPIKSKHIFGFFALSFSCHFIVITIYQILFNIYHITHAELSNLTLFLYYTPFLGFHIFQLLAWLYIVPRILNHKKNLKDLFTYIPIIIIAFSILFLFFMIYHSGIWYGKSPIFRSYSGLNAIFEFMIFIAVILSLSATKNKNVFLLAIGYLVFRSSSLIMTFRIFAQQYGIYNLLNLMMFFGMVTMIYGLVGFKKTDAYKTSPKTWVYPINSIRSQISFWILAIIIFTVSILGGVYYLTSHKVSFNRELFHGILSTLTIYLLISIALSKILADKICNPLQRMERLINLFMKSAKPAIPIERKIYNLTELKKHEQFLVHAFETLEEKHAAERYISKMAAQVAHDISSPLMAMQLALKRIEGLDEKAKATIHNIAGRINDISNYLLTEYKHPKIDKQSELFTEFMPDLINNIIFEKRFMDEAKKIEFNFKIADDAYTIFIKTDRIEFQRALSNIINNSIEAIDDKGGITVNLKTKDRNAIIEVIDNGRGMPQKIIDKITQGQFTSGKKSGTGLGLSYAIEKIKTWGGDYRIESKIGKGTKITIKLPKADYPAWFQEKIIIPADGKIVILEKSKEIYSKLVKRFDNIIHFHDLQQFIDFIFSSSGNDRYLIGEDIAGVCPEQLIKDLNIQQYAILITDKHSDQIFMGICQVKGIKAIPKSYVNHIPIEC